MDVIKNGSLNEKQKKNLSMLMGDLLVFSVMEQLLREYLYMLFDDETRDNEMVKLFIKDGPWATSDVFVLKSILRYDHRKRV
jgi:hypothetical protein